MGKKKTDAQPVTFRQLMQMGLGQLRFSPSVFYDMTITELTAAMQGANELEERGYQQGWEQTRWMAAVLLGPHTKSGKVKPTDLIRFPWETKKKSRKQQDEENKRELMNLGRLLGAHVTERPNS